MKNKSAKIISILIALLAALAFLIKFATPQLLKTYISFGIGDCKKIPVLCLIPTNEVMRIALDKELIKDYIPYAFPKMSVSAPKGFSVVQEMIKKYYYKKKTKLNHQSIIYVLIEDKAYFANLFSDAKKLGVNTNSDFIKHVMLAKPTDIKKLGDAFFVIMKSIFIPDVGDQRKATMAQFEMGNKKGFITYNLTRVENFFNCDLTTGTDAYFKVYIRDKGAKLGLDDVFAILSTLSETDGNFPLISN